MRGIRFIGFALISVFLALPLPAFNAQQSQRAAVKSTVAAPSKTFVAARSAAQRITEEQLRKYLYTIASDEMEGRDTPSRGLDATAKFIADRLAKLKVKPAGDNKSYFQRIDLLRTEVDRAKTTAELGGRTFKAGDDFAPVGRNGGEAEGQLVYVGHGWVFKPKNINPYEGLDVRGKIMIASSNGTTPPPGLTMRDLSAAAASEWESPISYAQKHGAKGLVLIPRAYERAWRAGQRAVNRSSYQVARFVQSDDEEEEEKEENVSGEQHAPGSLPMITPSMEMLNALFSGEQLNGMQVLRQTMAGQTGAGFELAATKDLRISVKLRNEHASTQNVVAVLEGSDPVLKKEYVALGAHYDHVGVGVPVNGDSIYNGADDDGSGTTALLAIAEAFARGSRPRRSILFVWHAGEEKGLWGSQYFTEHPTVPLANIITQLNIDMIGRSKKPGDTNPKNEMLTGSDEIYVIGSRMMSTQLGDLSEQVNRSYLNLRYNYHYDEPNDPERLFYRSDHFNYARKGVPIIFFFDGVHEDYHQPSDSPDKIDYQKMEKITRTIFILASELANAPQRPVVDKQIPPEQLER